MFKHQVQISLELNLILKFGIVLNLVRFLLTLEHVWEFVNCFLMSLFARHIVKILVHNYGYAQKFCLVPH